jgi:hypothetical protein
MVDFGCNDLGMDTVLNFGAHKGQQVEDLIDDAPDYIAWLVENEIRTFDEEAMQAFQKAGII